MKIRPIKVRQSVYLRVPSSIVDLIGLQTDAEVTLGLEEHEDEYLLTYAIEKVLASPALSLRRKRPEARLEPPATAE